MSSWKINTIFIVKKDYVLINEETIKGKQKDPIEQLLKGTLVSLIVIIAIKEVIILKIVPIGMKLMC